MPTGFPDYYGGLTLPVTVPEGGTGQTAVVAHALLIGNGTGALTVSNVGTAGQVLQIPALGGDPAFQDIAIDTSAISGILAIAHGGTGTSSPALVAGNGISITGSWPNQTITNSDDAYFTAGILAIAHGGTGTSSPALVAGNGISITGTWPNQTITNSDDAYFTAGILAIAHGGTGTSSPALTAGSNISISGSWPNNTIAVASSPTFSGTLTAETAIDIRNDTQSALHIQNAAGTDHWLIGENLSSGAQGSFYIYNPISTKFSLLIDTSDTLALSVPLPIGSGGTGATSFAAAGLLSVTASANLTGQTNNIGPTTLYTPGSAGMYRATINVVITAIVGTVTGFSVSVNGTEGGNAASVASASTPSTPVVGEVIHDIGAIYSDASAAITYSSSKSGTGTITFDIHIRLEAL